MSRILEKLADQHEERLLNVLYNLENDVVKEVTRASKGQLVSQRLAIQLQPKIRQAIQDNFLKEADILINDEYNKIAKEVLDNFGELKIPKKFKSLTEVDLQTINALKFQSFSGFEDIAERFLKVINDEVYQSAIAGRPFEDMVSNIRSHINGVYKQSNITEINELVDFVNENKFDVSKKAQVDEAIRKLHTQYASDRAGNNLRRYAGQIAHDSVMQFHGQFTVAKAKEAGIDKFAYTGTLVRDSREFCQRMLNRVLTEEQIREIWNTQGWAGKSTGDPFIVRGGYRCRHTWIPTIDETVDEIPEQPEVEETLPARKATENVADVSIASSLVRSDKAIKDAYDKDFNSQLTNQQKNIINKFEKPLEIRNSSDGFYASTTSILSAQLNATIKLANDKVGKRFVISHEYGHHLDYVTNKSKFESWSESNQSFKDAIIKDLNRYKVQKTYRGRPILKKEEYDRFHNDLYETNFVDIYSKSDPTRLISRNRQLSFPRQEGDNAISDIIDALSKGTFQRDYSGVYGHGVSYFRKRGMVQKEIFANLFSIKNNKKAYEKAKTIIPNTVKEFEKRLDELEKMEL